MILDHALLVTMKTSFVLLLQWHRLRTEYLGILVLRMFTQQVRVHMFVHVCDDVVTWPNFSRRGLLATTVERRRSCTKCRAHSAPTQVGAGLWIGIMSVSEMYP